VCVLCVVIFFSLSFFLSLYFRSQKQASQTKNIFLPRKQTLLGKKRKKLVFFFFLLLLLSESVRGGGNLFSL
jgi:hypothetical protein